MILHHNGTILIEVEQADIAADGRFIVPDSVTHIGERAFYHCTRLTEVIFNEGLTHIGEWAFYRCTSLTEVIFNEGLTHIGERAFYHCTRLTEVIFNEGLTHIGPGAFSDCTHLTEVRFNAGLTHIGPGAFSDCTHLTEVRFNAGLTYIGAGAFCDCTDLTEVIFNAGLTHIGGHAFFHCNKLTKVKFNAGLTRIGEDAFSYCDNLTEVILPESLTHHIIEPNALAKFAAKGNIFIIGRDQENDLKRIRGLLPENLGGKVFHIDLKTYEKAVSYRKKALEFLCDHPSINPLYFFRRSKNNHFFPVDIVRHINSFVGKDTGCYKEAKKEMLAIVLPRTEANLLAYKNCVNEIVAKWQERALNNDNPDEQSAAISAQNEEKTSKNNELEKKDYENVKEKNQLNQEVNSETGSPEQSDDRKRGSNRMGCIIS